MKKLNQIKNLKGKKVLLRVDFNVPLDEKGLVKNDFRIKRVLPTIEFLKKSGAKIIILSHIGREKDGTLLPVFEYLKKQIDLVFVNDIFDKKVGDVVSKMKNSDVVLFENLRCYEGEAKNTNNFSEYLASFGDLYVNDSFASSHRAHSSLVGIPDYLPAYTGLLFEEEVSFLSHIFEKEKSVFFVLGGNKFETKLVLMGKILQMAEKVFLGGALMNEIFKMRGLSVGLSSVANKKLDLKILVNNEKVILPTDVVVRKQEEVMTKKPETVCEDEKILDIGSETISDWKKCFKEAETILFNGPLGDYQKGFDRGTCEILRGIASSSAYSVVGGGDTILLIHKLGIEDKFNFISTGGGAMLSFLVNKTLPAIEAIKKSQEKFLTNNK